MVFQRPQMDKGITPACAGNSLEPLISAARE